MSELTTAAITASPWPWIFNGVEYKVKSLSLEDIGALENWAKAKVLTGIEETIKELSRDAQGDYRDSALAKLMTMNSDELYVAIVSRPEGRAKLMAMSTTIDAIQPNGTVITRNLTQAEAVELIKQGAFEAFYNSFPFANAVPGAPKN